MGADGRLHKLTGFNVDITEQKNSAEKIRYTADHDSLTGVLNRKGFEDRLSQFLDNSLISSGVQAAAIYFDLDRFR
jgi:GGDEF domain-containing protein